MQYIIDFHWINANGELNTYGTVEEKSKKDAQHTASSESGVYGIGTCDVFVMNHCLRLLVQDQNGMQLNFRCAIALLFRLCC